MEDLPTAIMGSGAAYLINHNPVTVNGYAGNTAFQRVQIPMLLKLAVMRYYALKFVVLELVLVVLVLELILMDVFLKDYVLIVLSVILVLR